MNENYPELHKRLAKTDPIVRDAFFHLVDYSMRLRGVSIRLNPNKFIVFKCPSGDFALVFFVKHGKLDWCFSEDVDLVLDWRVAGVEQDPMGERSKSPPPTKLLQASPQFAQKISKIQSILLCTPSSKRIRSE